MTLNTLKKVFCGKRIFIDKYDCEGKKSSLEYLYTDALTISDIRENKDEMGTYSIVGNKRDGEVQYQCLYHHFVSMLDGGKPVFLWDGGKHIYEYEIPEFQS